MARAAAQSGDVVEAENCYQHAEHYFRVMRAPPDMEEPPEQERPTESYSVALVSCVAYPSMESDNNLTRRAWPHEYIPRLSPPFRCPLGFMALSEAGVTPRTIPQRRHNSQSKGAVLRWSK
jgi:Domain of unknown function (DUF4167)